MRAYTAQMYTWPIRDMSFTCRLRSACVSPTFREATECPKINLSTTWLKSAIILIHIYTYVYVDVDVYVYVYVCIYIYSLIYLFSYVFIIYSFVPSLIYYTWCCALRVLVTCHRGGSNSFARVILEYTHIHYTCSDLLGLTYIYEDSQSIHKHLLIYTILWAGY